MGEQMTVEKTGAPGDNTTTWRAIDWQKARREVRRLQMRIAKAMQEGKQGKVNALQWILTHSFYAKALAVKRVTTNKGKKTPGIDGVLWTTARAKMQAIHRLRQKIERDPRKPEYIQTKPGLGYVFSE
jgi:RNA-directed DNA polymerase